MSSRAIPDPRNNILGHNMLRLAALDEVRAELERLGIPLLFLKGAAFLDTLYPDLAERAMCDIDVLVPARDMSRAARVLLAMGFRRSGPDKRPATYHEHYEWVYLRDEPFPITLELHRAFCQSQRHPIDYDALFGRAVVYHSHSRQIPTLCAEDSLLYVALHEAMHSFAIDGRSAEDVRRIIAGWHPNWGLVVSRAKEWHMTLALYVCLCASVRQQNAEVPSHVMDALRPGRLRRAILHKLLHMHRTAHAPTVRVGRLRQLFTLVLTIEAPNHLMQFCLYYARLRVRDLALLAERRFQTWRAAS
ncbi:MAG: nucleotidyltransferase family protein [Myxococcales bacterium]|nr:nucleotidyltransferase family protein [Myxococcales bacterium]MCB9709416.1 nucleotidyltransferase family protein [Myxococcales bacterium]